jgi:aconitate hydratase
LGDNVTTDHVSPISRILPDSPAGKYLRGLGADERALGSYGDRRANHHVMLRGTFDNARLDNRLASGPGNRAIGPDGTEHPVFDAAMAFAMRDIPLVIVAGTNYGTGSARDWAAKGTALLGVRAVIARSFERIHRTNLIALGVLPVIVDGELPALDAESLISLRGIGALRPGQAGLTLEIARKGGAFLTLAVRADVASASQFAMLRSGGLFAGLKARFARR